MSFSDSITMLQDAEYVAATLQTRRSLSVAVNGTKTYTAVVYELPRVTKMPDILQRVVTKGGEVETNTTPFYIDKTFLPFNVKVGVEDILVTREGRYTVIRCVDFLNAAWLVTGVRIEGQLPNAILPLRLKQNLVLQSTFEVDNG